MDIKNINQQLDIFAFLQKSNIESHSSDTNLSKENNLNLENIKKNIEKLDEKQIENIFNSLKEKFDYMNKYLKIEIDKDLKEPVVKIIDKKTNEVIRQIPPEYLLELAKKIDNLEGFLYDKEV